MNNMENATIGISKESYNKLKDICTLRQISLRYYISSLIEEEYNKHKEAIEILKKAQKTLTSTNANSGN